MAHKQYIHRPTVLKELTIIIIVNLFLLIFFTQVDVLEWLYLFSRDHEWLELDELFPLGATLALSFLIFSYRRIKELGLLANTLEQMSLIDPLTGLPNRRSGQISLISWCELAQRKGQTFAVYQIDLDAFKQVNDSYGQMVGDDVLRLIARLFNEFLPESALLCRWFDDNFLVIVRLDVIENPHQYAYQLQSVIQGKVLASTLNLTASVGYKVWQPGQKVEDILHDTEDALMRAKHLGRNQVKGN